MKIEDSLWDATSLDSYKIDLRYHIALKTAELWAVALKKLHCLAKSMHLGVLALTWRPRDVEAKKKGQGSRD